MKRGARQKEFDDRADYKDRLRDYKETPPPTGLFDDVRKMGGAPPKK